MAWLFKKKDIRMEIPPPPPVGEGEKEGEAEKKPEPAPMPMAELPPSELPEIKPEAKEIEKELPEFPEIPKEEEAEAAEIAKEVGAPERVVPIEAGPKFVKTSSFVGALSMADEIRKGLKRAEESIIMLNEIKKEEEDEFQRWRKQLEDTEKKLSYMDQIVFKGA